MITTYITYIRQKNRAKKALILAGQFSNTMNSMIDQLYDVLSDNNGFGSPKAMLLMEDIKRMSNEMAQREQVCLTYFQEKDYKSCQTISSFVSDLSVSINKKVAELRNLIQNS